ncbi:MAG TPA: hypothetical protein VFI25_17505 [Planctomycetota bacterium]|nr:hypothetical protein [Planctomycetota bacterium]
MGPPPQAPGPIGPAHWTARNWVGVGLYLLLFAAAVYGIWRLARPPATPANGEEEPRPPGRT